MSIYSIFFLPHAVLSFLKKNVLVFLRVTRIDPFLLSHLPPAIIGYLAWRHKSVITQFISGTCCFHLRYQAELHPKCPGTGFVQGPRGWSVVSLFFRPVGAWHPDHTGRDSGWCILQHRMRILPFGFWNTAVDNPCSHGSDRGFLGHVCGVAGFDLGCCHINFLMVWRKDRHSFTKKIHWLRLEPLRIKLCVHCRETR